MKFTKMQGAGNDYVYINGFSEKIEEPGKLARRISDRHFGIGSDGLVLILPSRSADFRMRMFNADGSEAEMCGNASRCIGKYVYDKGLTRKTELTLETKAGIRRLKLFVSGKAVDNIEVDMGEPLLSPAAIPVEMPGECIVDRPLRIAGREYRITCVSMGNPHTVVFTKKTGSLDLQAHGRDIETHSCFPEHTNVEFAEVLSPSLIRMRVWERGAGETLACGTGACATLVAAVFNGFSEREAVLRLKGGDLKIRWDEHSGHVFMTGDAVTVFEGDFYE